MPPKEKCTNCEKPCVGPFCYACLGKILSQPAPPVRPSWMESTYTYPPIKRKKRK